MKIKKGKYFREGWRYLNESWRYVLVALGLFVVFSVVGFVFAEHFSFIDSMLEDLLKEIEGLGGKELIWFILKNNVGSAFSTLIFGTVFGILPVISLVANGIVLGYVLEGVLEVAGIGEFWRLLPHGIFELPAIFISLGLGMKLGMFVFAKKKMKEFKRRFVNSLVVFFTIVLPLLIIAAIIEGIMIAVY